jgi:hypothetical protein
MLRVAYLFLCTKSHHHYNWVQSIKQTNLQQEANKKGLQKEKIITRKRLSNSIQNKEQTQET